MDKAEALKKIVQESKERDEINFQNEVESLIWEIKKKSQELRDLKKELTELTFKETEIPDISDCIK